MKAPRQRVFVLLALVSTVAIGTAAEGLKGLTLREALARLQRAGVPLVYSSSLVTAGMRVTEEPRGGTMREKIEALLAPHGLTIRERAGRLVVVLRPEEAQRDGAAAVTMPVLLEEIVVTPSHFRLLQEEPARRDSLTRAQIDRMPHLGGDPFRAVKALPGTSGSDVSARFHVRGGDADEVAVVLDGFELFEPYHLKDFMNLFSTIESSTVGTIDLMTGGFPVEYGDRMSGVMEITSAAVLDGSASASVGTLNGSVVLAGRDAGWSWFLAGRGWYPDLLLGALKGLSGEIQTDYSDLFAKASRPISDRSLLTVATLASWDDLGLVEEEPDETERVGAEYGSLHLWATVETSWTDRLRSRTTAGGGNLTRERSLFKAEAGEGELTAADDRRFHFLSLEQDWAFEASERHLFKFGVEVRDQSAAYDYRVESSYEGGPPAPGGDPSDRDVQVALEPRGTAWGAYLAERVKLSRGIVAEAGVRWDKQSWNEENQVSPRVQLRWDLTPGVVARLAWGRYAQSQRLNEIQVEDGVTELFPAQRSEHWVAGLEAALARGIAMRVEAYHKDIRNVRPRWENLFNALEVFPEVQRDRVRIAPNRAASSGAEIAAGGGERLQWWGSYTWARAVDRVDAVSVPRSWDQRHTIRLGANRAFGAGWDVSLAGVWHTGWPITPLLPEVPEDAGEEIELVAGPRNSGRLPDYLRLDLRASKTFPTRRGSITLIADVQNATNRENVCCVDGASGLIGADGRFVVARELEHWAPITPSIAIRWRR